jgi:hypothetical protein
MARQLHARVICALSGCMRLADKRAAGLGLSSAPPGDSLEAGMVEHLKAVSPLSASPYL